MTENPRPPERHADIAADRVARAGGAPKYHQANAAKGKLFARERIALLVDDGSFVEDGLFANALADGPARGRRDHRSGHGGRTSICLMANDSTVKAGSWGARTVEKIIRIIERAYSTGVPMIYLVDSAGARITDQVELGKEPRSITAKIGVIAAYFIVRGMARSCYRCAMISAKRRTFCI